MPIRCYSSGVRAPQGPPGDRGAEVVPGSMPKPGKKGNDGEIIFSRSSFEALGARLDTVWVPMQLHQAELDYLNKSLESAADRLLFIHDILENIKSIASDPANPRVSFMLSGRISDEIKSYHQRVKVLLIQLSQGLNYYGYPQNHVPLTSVAIYKTFIQQLLVLGREVENAFKNYHVEQQSAESRRVSISTAINSLEIKSNLLADQMSQLVIELEDTRSQVDALLKQQLQLQVQLENAAQSFRDAVSRKGDCGFVDILKAGAAIVAIASGVGAVEGGIAAISLIRSRMDAAKMKNDLAGRAKYVTGELREIGGGLDSIKNGYTGIKAVLTDRPDGAKLLLDEGSFEDTIKQFEDLEEAQVYKRLMRQFLDLVNTRNKQILHADAIATRINEIDSEVGSIHTEVLSTKGRLLETDNPYLAANIVFFERANNRIKADILRTLYLEYRALAYWSLKNIELPDQATDRSIDHLSNIHAAFLTTYLREIEERNTAPNSFTGPVEIVFSRTANPELFSVFDQTGAFSFKLSETLPMYRALSGILIKTLVLRIKGLKFQETPFYTVLLTHQGNPRFVNGYGGIMEFKHRKRTLFQFYNRREDEIFELGGLEEKYAYLSPFASWTISVFGSNENIPVPTNAIEELGLTFSGIAYARYPG